VVVVMMMMRKKVGKCSMESGFPLDKHPIGKAESEDKAVLSSGKRFEDI
jgi:hypothetical protein